MVYYYSIKLGDDPEFLRFSCAQIIIKSAQDNLGLVGFLGCELTLNHIKSNWVMTRAGLRETCLDESPRAGCGRGVATTSLWYLYLPLYTTSSTTSTYLYILHALRVIIPPLSSDFESPSLWSIMWLAVLYYVSTMLYPVSLLSGCWDRLTQKSKYKYRDHLVGNYLILCRTRGSVCFFRARSSTGWLI